MMCHIYAPNGMPLCDDDIDRNWTFEHRGKEHLGFVACYPEKKIEAAKTHKICADCEAAE